jgi:ribosomal protein L11 methyltransferase
MGLRRVSVSVPAERAEEARAVMLELFPDGFEEVGSVDGVELIAYTDAGGEERLWQAFGGARSADVDEGWEQRWRDFHQPVVVGPLWLGPPWLEPPRGATAVVIEPGRAFGTGAHATTRLCLELLLELERGSLLDVGCGSGVLAIAAAKVGFAPVLALDSEPAAVEGTRANALANGVEVEVRLADALTDPLPATDLVVANVTGSFVEMLADRVPARLLVGSGFLSAEQPKPAGYRSLRRAEVEGWAAEVFSPETE